MIKPSWPTFLALVFLAVSDDAALAQKRNDATRQHGWDCSRKQQQFERTLGYVREYPGAGLRFALNNSNNNNAKPDFPVCYNRRERLKREVQIDQWRRAHAPECLGYFRAEEAERAREMKARGGPPEKPLQSRIAEYNESCSHTMAGTI